MKMSMNDGINKDNKSDIVEVVRCKNCEFSKYNECSMELKCLAQKGMYRTVKPEDFCSYGEKI